jgi:hypothetical protein
VGSRDPDVNWNCLETEGPGSEATWPPVIFHVADEQHSHMSRFPV